MFKISYSDSAFFYLFIITKEVQWIQPKLESKIFGGGGWGGTEKDKSRKFQKAKLEFATLW